MKYILLTQGKCAIVDNNKYEWLNQWKWFAQKIGNNFYAARDTKDGYVYMHRLILNAGKGKLTDHKNQNGLDNRVCNLRLCTHSQNHQNQKPYKSKSSQYKGVCWHKQAKKWFAYIKLNRKQIHLGLHINEIEAARVYDKKAKEIFGEFAYLNFRKAKKIA